MFRTEYGNDGIGTISFLHIASNRYLYRSSDNIIILKDITTGNTEDKQRASFNLYDSNLGIGGIMLKAMLIEGETTDKFISLDGNYLSLTTIKNDKSNDKSNGKSNDKSNDKSTFYIIDFLLNTNIITSKNNIPISTNNNNIPISTNNNKTNTFINSIEQLEQLKQLKQMNLLNQLNNQKY